MTNLTITTDTIDRNALFLNLFRNKEIKTINNEKVVLIKKENILIIESEFKTITLIPFVDGLFGFGIEYLNKKFFIPINFNLNVNREFKKLHQYFNSYLIEELLENIHKNI